MMVLPPYQYIYVNKHPLGTHVTLPIPETTPGPSCRPRVNEETTFEFERLKSGGYLQLSAVWDKLKLSKRHLTGVSLRWSKRQHPSALPKLRAYRDPQQVQPVVHELRLYEVIDD